MIIRPVSDLHVEFWPQKNVCPVLASVIPEMPCDGATVLVIAGDIGLAHKEWTWRTILNRLARRFKAVVYVEGNHFYYHNDYFGRLNQLESMQQLPGNVYFLENDSIEIDGVLFIGATLWTDFNAEDFESMFLARGKMSDFHIISTSMGNLLHPHDTVLIHQQSRKFIFDILRRMRGKRTVVVTHHGISPQSIHERYHGELLNGAYMSDFSSDIIKHGPDLWIHGHMHDSFAYQLGTTRVVVNPFGYWGVAENADFDCHLTIEVTTTI